MKDTALLKAIDHLEQAKAQLREMDFAKGQRHYERAWSLFLTQVGRFYAKLEQGCKGCGKSQAWFGEMRRQRRQDPLLSYIRHARNSDEHSLNVITGRSADSVAIEVPSSNEVRVSAWMRLRSDGTLDVVNPTVETEHGPATSIIEVNPRLALLPVEDRGVSYQPPLEHLGKSLVDDSPYAIACLAVSYLEARLSEAHKLPTQP